MIGTRHDGLRGIDVVLRSPRVLPEQFPAGSVETHGAQGCDRDDLTLARKSDEHRRGVGGAVTE